MEANHITCFNLFTNVKTEINFLKEKEGWGVEK